MAAPPIPEETVITERAANVIVSQLVGAASRCRYTDSNNGACSSKLHASSAAEKVLGKAILLELKMRRLNSVIQEAS